LLNHNLLSIKIAISRSIGERRTGRSAFALNFFDDETTELCSLKKQNEKKQDDENKIN